ITPNLERQSSQPRNAEYLGDYLENWERRLIPINKLMAKDFKDCSTCVDHMCRIDQVNYLPSHVLTIIAEFRVVPKCSDCGIESNLWLNLGDGFIGCGRAAKLPGLEGKGCSEKHYTEKVKGIQKYFISSKKESKPETMVVKLGTITSESADVWDYEKDKDPELPQTRLKSLLKNWGIDMVYMYQFDKTMAELHVELTNTYLNPNRNDQNKKNRK
ncbi:hypothetical protein RFI_38987, partial [Reticulomyxa filosa]